MPAPSASGPGGSVPPIRTFQFDSSAIGQLSSAVNLFRGDVNILQSLFTLPGRHSGGGLDVDVSILYQSNVARQASLWNRDAPTGVVGLGWGLPLSYVEATTTGSPDPDTRTYVLYDSSGANTLTRQAHAPFLFQVPAAAASTLASGQAISTAVLSLFRQSGLPLDSGANVSGQPGSWTIDDAVLQQVFAIQASTTNPSTCDVSYGGLAFQPQSYHFWHVVYFPAYRRWLIVDDHGLRKSFGGVAPGTPQGYRAAVGNSVAWEVWWGASGASCLDRIKRRHGRSDPGGAGVVPGVDVESVRRQHSIYLQRVGARRLRPDPGSRAAGAAPAACRIRRPCTSRKSRTSSGEPPD